MAQRPRSHVIEDESRRAFAAALGPSLLFRDEEHDYGLDGDVEHFDEGGNSTGLRFYVQLKATDEPDLGKALRRWLPLERANQYRDLPGPLLMVRYHAPTERLFARWFHQFDPYYGGQGEKGLTFRWLEDDAWAAETPKRLVADARAFFELRSPRLPLPYRLHLDEDVSLGPLARGQIGVALRTAARRCADAVAVSLEPPTPGAGTVSVSGERLTVSLATVSGASLHIDDQYVEATDARALAADLFVLCALAFERIGHDDLASRLARCYLVESRLWQQEEPVWALALSMGRARRVLEALEVAEALDVDDDDDRAREASFWFTLPALMNASSLTESESDRYVSVMRQRQQRRLQAGLRVEAARETMNMANHYRTRAKPEEALALYAEAARHDPAYEDRAHYWYERGGALFGSQHYVEAAEAYQRALALGGDRFAQALRADSLMLAGRYREALDAFDDYDALAAGREAEWRLKTRLLRAIVDGMSVGAQQRRTEDAERTTETGLDEDESRLRPVLDRALNLDALCGLAWFNLAVWHGNREEWALARDCYLNAALCQEWDVEAWANALLLSLDQDELDLAQDIGHTAARLVGADAMVDHLSEWADRQSPAVRDGFFAVVSALLTVDDDHRHTFKLRFLAEDGRVDTIEMGAEGAVESQGEDARPDVNDSC